MKRCSKCKLEKDESLFQNNVSRPDGKSIYCKACAKIYEDKRQIDPKRVAYEKQRSHDRYLNLAPEEKEKRRALGREYDRRRWREDTEFREKKKQHDKNRVRVLTLEQKKRIYASRVKMFKNSPETRERYRVRDKIGIHNRKAKKLGLDYGLTVEEWYEIIKGCNSECYYCGNYIPLPEIEHKIPTSRGGGNTKENVVVACPTCNTKKQKRTHAEFIEVIRANPHEYFYVKRLP